MTRLKFQPCHSTKCNCILPYVYGVPERNYIRSHLGFSANPNTSRKPSTAGL